jgi:hypothetical protein
VGPVEDPDHPRRGELSLHPPQEVVGLLDLGRGLEGLDLDPLRVHHPDGVTDHAPLSGGVHPLEDEQHLLGLRVLDSASGVEPLLQVAQFGGQGLGQGLGVLLAVARKAGGGSRVQRREVNRPRR